MNALDEVLLQKSNIGHHHYVDAITGLDDMRSLKSNTGHSDNVVDITDLTTPLLGYA